MSKGNLPHFVGDLVDLRRDDESWVSVVGDEAGFFLKGAKKEGFGCVLGVDVGETRDGW